MSNTSQPLDWKPGMGHQVTPGTGYDDERGILDWRCVDCGQWFARWPADDQECPGPADPEQQGYARGFAQGIAFAKARRQDENRLRGAADGPGVAQGTPDPQETKEAG